MAITPKATSERVIRELDLTPAEFRWSANDSLLLEQMVSKAISNAAIRTRTRVGATNYASTDATTVEDLTEGEHALACANMLRRRLVILTSRPEEAPPPEYIDEGSIREEIDRFERDWAEITATYATSDGDKAGTGFSFGAGGIDETEVDDYSDMDYGELPSDEY